MNEMRVLMDDILILRLVQPRKTLHVGGRSAVHADVGGLGRFKTLPQVRQSTQPLS
ncbi:hypothetical protein [Cohnella zeiphila]|uniref:Uncharacterized protein n=1 Tax=Cohnella zeiphila TaxID=2761120 RepID=A0A7X0SH29_9BACL|nr:hypothetical protein [Cohnella zeiphila]MBB6729823.1 hypothetical protein [Cohnella zeiphila]